MDLDLRMSGFEYKWKKFLISEPLEQANKHSDNRLAGLPPHNPPSYVGVALFSNFLRKKGTIATLPADQFS